MLVPFAFVIHYGVVAHEEACLGRKFGDVYDSYRLHVWGHVTMQRDCVSPSPSDYAAKRNNPHGMGLLGPCAITMKMAENTPASTKLPKRAARMGIR
jgi:hypothetical protein